MAKFKLYGNLESLLDAEQPVELDATNVGAAIAKLTERFPALVGELVHENGEFNRYYSVIVNGEMMEFLDDLDTTLNADDEVTFFPPIAA